MTSGARIDISALHQALVDELKHKGYLYTSPVEAAFRAVPRHLFLPDVAPDEVYRDQSIPTKRLDNGTVSSSSQPAIMAVMLDQLELQPGQRVLEIGAGTGYNAALMAHIVGDTGQVVTVDIDEDIVKEARDHVAAAGFQQVQVVCSDGGLGYPAAAPYDRIILTVGAWDIAPAWREQLKPKGRILLPLSIRGPQLSVAFEPAGDHLVSISVKPCGFMRLRGAFAGPEASIRLGSEPGLSIMVEERDLINAEVIYKVLTAPGKNLATTIQAAPGEIFCGLKLWLALREPGFCSLNAEGELTKPDIVSDLFRFSSKSEFRGSIGLAEKDSLCLLTPPPDQPPLLKPIDDAPPCVLFVQSFGPDETLAHRLIKQIVAWDAAGRPSTEGLCIRAYPEDSKYAPSANEFIVQKQFSQLVLDWS
jgi:protein-L-isoaspartate(D-aspartate) O-methyltransferase